MGRRVAVEALGTAFLLAAVIGSGVMGERLAGGNVAIAYALTIRQQIPWPDLQQLLERAAQRALGV